MTVFVAHAPADSEAAEGLEKFLERRGEFVELDDGQTVLRPVQPSDVVVLLHSGRFLAAGGRLRLEQRALDAWAEGRLVLVRLDEAQPPVGLRDFDSIAVRMTAPEEADWQAVGEAVRQKAAARRASAEAVPPPASAQAGASEPGGGLPGALALIAAMLPGVGALVVMSAIWLVNRIGPTPGGWAELRAGVGLFGRRYGVPADAAEVLFAAAIVLMLGAAVVLLLRVFGRRSVAAASRGTASVFVSFAPANRSAVLPVLETAQRGGPQFVVERRRAADAIRGAAGVIVMCSKAAFENDEVKRDIFLADRYGKKLSPVYIEQADPPADFEYFLSGAPGLRLYETPEHERAEALLRALGASA